LVSHLRTMQKIKMGKTYRRTTDWKK